MRSFIAIFIALLTPSIAYADWMIRFNDKTANVWKSYYEKGDHLCTENAFGEYCVLKDDDLVKSHAA